MLIIEHDIRDLVPHTGAMCLLQRIVSATDREIVCATRTHAMPDNPLRRNGELASLHLAEYGAQAMAVHGGMLEMAAGGAVPARGGMLVAIRELSLEVARIDDIAAEIHVRAMKLVANAEGRIYSFSAHAGERLLAGGRISVISRE